MKPDNLIQTWLGLYEARTAGTLAGANATVKLDADNVPQPDALLMILPSHGGQAQIGQDGLYPRGLRNWWWRWRPAAPAWISTPN